MHSHLSLCPLFPLTLSGQAFKGMNLPGSTLTVCNTIKMENALFLSLAVSFGFLLVFFFFFSEALCQDNDNVIPAIVLQYRGSLLPNWTSDLEWKL